MNRAVRLAAAVGLAVVGGAEQARWDFDDAAAGSAGLVTAGGVETVAGGRGRALVLDGFSGWAQLPVGARTGEDSFAISLWVAPAAWPWHAVPLVDAAESATAGFRLELTAEGRVRFGLAAGGRWQEIMSPQALTLRRWQHVRAVWRAGDGIWLALDGVEVARAELQGDHAPALPGPWVMGRSRHAARPAGALRPEATAEIYSYFDGALDDLVVTTPAGDATAPPPEFAAAPPLPPRVLPSGPAGPGPFGAFNTALAFYPQWDRSWRTGPSADVVVRFDTFPGRLVFWRGTSYIPHWVTENGIWFTNEFNETWGDMRGSGEPMSDKQCRYSRVAILESGEARAVVHWRYALTDVYYQIARADPVTGWGDWSDEVYTIYPDGTAVREITLHTGRPDTPHEWHEAIVVLGPGWTPEQALEPAALTVGGADGTDVTFSWADAVPPWTPAQPADCVLQLVHTRSRYRPFTLVRPQDRGSFNIFAKEVRREVSMFPWWNHWPAAQNPSDGRYALAADRPSHASLSNIDWQPSATGPGWMRKVMLTGLTERSAGELRPLLRAWAQPPPVRVSDGAIAAYDPGQKAWTVETRGGAVELTIEASAASPVEHAAFVLRDWGEAPVAVVRDGRTLVRGTDYRAQIRRGLAGTDLIVWLPFRAEQPTTLTLTRPGA